MTQRWSAIVWCHWPVPASVVAERLPPGVVPDRFDGRAWVGFVPFEMQDLRLRVLGRRLPRVPSTSDFSEVNVRTYVTGPFGPGVWFDTLDASSWLGSTVARLAWSLPYLPSRITSSAGDGPGRRRWRVARRSGAEGSVDAVVGDVLGQPGPLDRFLTERYALYSRAWWSARRALWAPVAHEPWVLRRCSAEVDAGLVRLAGYDVPDRPAHVLAGDAAAVRIGLPTVV